MSELAPIAAAVFKRAAGRDRVLVAIAGPPAAGKSTISAALVSVLPPGEAIVVPMDGFHYDDAVLARKGLSHCKGAPETFDFAGFEALLRRIRAGGGEIAIPVFDRSMELSRAAADIIDPAKRFILVEGNYLLLDEEPWARLAPLFDFTIFVGEPRAELETRLVKRWRDHGREDAAARHWIETNDLPNVDRVLARRRVADLTLGDI